MGNIEHKTYDEDKHNTKHKNTTQHRKLERWATQIKPIYSSTPIRKNKCLDLSSLCVLFFEED
jgi:hypothetical protein